MSFQNPIDLLPKELLEQLKQIQKELWLCETARYVRTTGMD